MTAPIKNKDVGRRVEDVLGYALEQLGWSKSHLASVLQVPRSTVCRWFSGERVMGPRYATQVSAALGIDASLVMPLASPSADPAASETKRIAEIQCAHASEIEALHGKIRELFATIRELRSSASKHRAELAEARKMIRMVKQAVKTPRASKSTAWTP